MSELQVIGEKEKAEYSPLIERARAAAIAIVDAPSFTIAGNLYTEIKGRMKKVHKILDPFVDRAYKAYKADYAERDRYLAPLEEAEALLKKPLGEWQAAEKRKQEEAQRALEAQARKEAEEAQIAQAEAAAAAGNKEMAEEIISQPTVAAPVVAPKIVPKVAGLSFRDSYSAQVTDLKALLKGVLEGTVPMAAIEANQSFLNTQARALKAELKYPGVRVLNNNTPVGRG